MHKNPALGWCLGLGWAAKAPGPCAQGLVPHTAQDNCTDPPIVLQTEELQFLELPTPQLCLSGSPHIPHPVQDKSAGGSCGTHSSGLIDQGQCPLSHTWSRLDPDSKSKSLLNKTKRDVSVTTRKRFIPCMGGEKIHARQCLVSISNVNGPLDIK